MDSSEAVCIIQGGSGTLYSRVQVQYRNMPASSAEQMLLGLLPGTADARAEGDLVSGLGDCSSWPPCGFYLPGPLPGFAVFTVMQHGSTEIKELCSICFPVLGDWRDWRFSAAEFSFF